MRPDVLRLEDDRRQRQLRQHLGAGLAGDAAQAHQHVATPAEQQPRQPRAQPGEDMARRLAAVGHDGPAQRPLERREEADAGVGRGSRRAAQDDGDAGTLGDGQRRGQSLKSLAIRSSGVKISMIISGSLSASVLTSIIVEKSFW